MRAATGQSRPDASKRPRVLARIVVAFLLALLVLVPPTPLTSASPARRTLRIMTYNIPFGVGMDKKQDLRDGRGALDKPT